MEKIKRNEPFYKSKTKWAGILTGIGIMLPGVISWFNGNGLGIPQIWTGITAILMVFGIRDLPALNKK